MSPDPALDAILDDRDRQLLLQFARGTVEYVLKNGKAPTAADLGGEPTPNMRRTMAAFVTLTKAGGLRGCIGEIFATRPLFESVIANAQNAAFRDPRFPAVAAAELPLLRFEISALTEPKPVASYDQIVLGKHGMVLKKDGRSAVFLPQVAPEQGWDLATTLTHLSRKAGLQTDAWKEGANFTVFEAIVFHENPGM